MTSYEETLQILFQLKASDSKKRTEDVRFIWDVLGNPQNSYKIIHVTGTNGKGTVSRH